VNRGGVDDPEWTQGLPDDIKPIHPSVRATLAIIGVGGCRGAED